MDATIFHCPQCGAAVEQNATQCRYCHALLKTVACPKCLGMMFAGVEFCPHCGVRVQKIGQPLAAGTACPRCKTALKRFDVAGIALDECPSCGGMWLSVTAFDNVCSNQAAQTAATGLALPPPMPLKSDAEHVHYISCPQCGNMMNRMNYAGGSGVIINICRAHGIWLDHDELHQIIDFIHAGGLDRLRTRQHEQLERDQKMVEAERSTPSPLDMYTTNGYGRSPGFYGSLLGALAHMFTSGL
jgi:Zn-finger nucleic acid-binding protein